MVILTILLLILFRRECGILLLSISEFISGALKQPTEIEENATYSTNKKDK